MKRMLVTSSAIALILSAVPAFAQQQTSPEEKAAPSQRSTNQPQSQNGRDEDRSRNQRERQQVQRGEGDQGATSKRGAAQEDQRKRASEQDRSKESVNQGKAQAERNKDSAGTKERGDKAASEKAQTPAKERQQGTAQDRSKEPVSRTTEGQKAGQGQKAEQGQTSERSSQAGTSRTEGRVQLSEQERVRVHETVLKSSRINRVTNVHVTVEVGSRVPRDVRLEFLPTEVVSIAPAYRGYRYFVVDDRVCIVDPSSYEIVDVVIADGRIARGHDTRAYGLTLTVEERRILVREIEPSSESTLGLGALSKGAPAPREATLQSFPEPILRQIPKLEGYRYFNVDVADPAQSVAGCDLEVIERRRQVVKPAAVSLWQEGPVGSYATNSVRAIDTAITLDAKWACWDRPARYPRAQCRRWRSPPARVHVVERRRSGACGQCA